MSLPAGRLPDGSPSARWWWLAILLAGAVIPLRAASYAGRPHLFYRMDLIADADAAAFARLWTTFGWGRVYGEPTRGTSQRAFSDVVQAHKVKHLLAAATGHAVWRALAPLSSLGLSDAARLRSVNAMLEAANLLLFVFLLRALAVPLRVGAPVAVLLSVAASPWIVGAQPESWTLSATVVLAVLLLIYRGRHPALIGAAVGIGMLNNIMLGALALPFVFEAVRAGATPVAFRRLATFAGAAALAWSLSLAAASRADPALRPDRTLATLGWFRSRNAYLLESSGRVHHTAAYVVRRSLEGAFIGSVIADQDDVTIPVDAVCRTVRGSWVGRIGTLLWLAMGLAAVGLLLKSAAPDARWRAAGLAAFVVTSVLGTALTYWPSQFLYSVPVVPVLLACVAIGLGRLTDRAAALVWLVVLSIGLANADQIRRIRRGTLVTADSTAPVPPAEGRPCSGLLGPAF